MGCYKRIRKSIGGEMNKLDKIYQLIAKYKMFGCELGKEEEKEKELLNKIKTVLEQQKNTYQ